MVDLFSISRCILLHAVLASAIRRSESAIEIVTTSFKLPNRVINVKTLNEVTEFSVNIRVVTETNPAMAELVKNSAQILETMNPRVRISEISFLSKKKLKHVELTRFKTFMKSSQNVTTGL